MLSIAGKVAWPLQQLPIFRLSLWMRQHYGQVVVMDAGLWHNLTVMCVGSAYGEGSARLFYHEYRHQP